LQETTVKSDKLSPVQLLPQEVKALFPPELQFVMKCHSAEYRHKVMKVNHVLLLSPADTSTPKFGRIIAVYYDKTTDCLVLSYEVVKIIHYNARALAYYVEFSGTHAAMNAEDVQHPLACFTYKKRGQFNHGFVTIQSHRLHCHNDRIGNN